jgi:hypothetical protein
MTMVRRQRETGTRIHVNGPLPESNGPALDDDGTLTRSRGPMPRENGALLDENGAAAASVRQMTVAQIPLC